jgi:hypothetical protein
MQDEEGGICEYEDMEDSEAEGGGGAEGDMAGGGLALGGGRKRWKRACGARWFCTQKATASRRPHFSPNKTPMEVENLLVEKRKLGPGFGVRRLIEEFELPLSHNAAPNSNISQVYGYITAV